jgi:hypothetical protein
MLKRLNGKKLLVKIDKPDQQGDVIETEAGVYIPKETTGVREYKVATVVQAGEEIKNIYKKGDTLMLEPEARDRPITVDGETCDLIPEGAVIGII